MHLQSVSPGPVNTDMLAGIGQRFNADISKVDMKMLEAEDVANAVICSLSTPPNVLVSVPVTTRLTIYSYARVYIL